MVQDKQEPWHGTTWQVYVVKLLRLRHRLDLVEIPDTTQGDCGIEAFSRDGSCYQCYAPQGNPTHSQRYDKCREKITDDINKFCHNANGLQKLFGPTKIRRWAFITPKHDNKKLVEHAEKKAQEVRAKKLPYATDDFSIFVGTDEEFAKERNELHREGLHPLDINAPGVSEDVVRAYADTNSGQISNLDRKLAKLRHQKGSIERLKTILLKYYLRGENALGDLRQYPDVYEKVHSCQSNRAEVVEARSLISTRDPKAHLEQTILEFQDELLSEVPNLSMKTAELLAWASAAGWLLQCPLDFPGVDE
jgi:hypothetical protein